MPSDIAGSIRTPHRSFRNIITQGLDFIQKGLKLVTFSKICTVGNCHPQNSPLRFKRSDKRGLPFQCPLEILLNQPRFTMVNISVCAYCGSTCMVTRYYDIIFYICSGGYPFSVTNCPFNSKVSHYLDHIQPAIDELARREKQHFVELDPNALPEDSGKSGSLQN